MNANMLAKQLENKIIELVTVAVGTNLRKPLTLQTEILESKLLDSFGILQLIAEIEKEFNVNISAEEMTMKNFSTISGIAELIKSYHFK